MDLLARIRKGLGSSRPSGASNEVVFLNAMTEEDLRIAIREIHEFETMGTPPHPEGHFRRLQDLKMKTGCSPSDARYWAEMELFWQGSLRWVGLRESS